MDDFNPAEVCRLKVLSYQPRYAEYPVIQLPNQSSPRPSENHHFGKRSPLVASPAGQFETLPYDVLSHLMSFLDSQSLVFLGMTNWNLQILVSSLPAYKAVTTHAFHALRALKATKLIGYHAISQIYRALRTDRCAYCVDYGPLLFLLTCERVCFNCVEWDYSLRLIPKDAVETCFGLSPSELQSVPVMSCVGFLLNQRGIRHVVCVKQARAAAIAVYGSEEETDHRMQSLHTKHSECYTTLDWDWPRDCIHLNRHDLLGAASVAFPSLDPRDGSVFYGVQCSGCDRLYRAWEGPEEERERELELHHLNHHTVAFWNKTKRDCYRFLTRREALEHFKSCEIAQHMWDQESRVKDSNTQPTLTPLHTMRSSPPPSIRTRHCLNWGLWRTFRGPWRFVSRKGKMRLACPRNQSRSTGMQNIENPLKR